ncbi:MULTISPECIES: hypothetical protein [Paenibacillus]|uniref:hypothetical protein n=1 Tax=Paenibacillus TaxID=44249 RepID=UPI000CFA08D0|nr:MULTISPECIES: hypothetical protein [Paenibacillus]MBJ9989696.1 hypothetical protein [Paenibacillus sp. S28]PQP90912.1 hypothetical protein CPT76_03540 [Paenibacillus sp. AR247]
MSFDDLLMELKGQKSAQEESGRIALDKLLNGSFMRKHSSFASFQEFLENGNFHAETQEELNKIPDELLDRHVSRQTDFKDWKTMLEQANADYAANNG